MSVPFGFSGLSCIDFNLCFKTCMIKIVTHCREGQLDKTPPPKEIQARDEVGAFTGRQPRILHCSHTRNQPYMWDLMCFKNSGTFWPHRQEEDSISTQTYSVFPIIV